MYRFPLQESQGRKRSARNCISTRTTPSPSHASQRPPGTLNEKAPGFIPCTFAAGVAAKMARICVEDTDIGDGVRPRGPADRRLVNHFHRAEGLGPFDAAAPPRLRRMVAEGLPEVPVQNVVDECALPAPAHPGDAHERMERDPDVNPLQVVLAGPTDDKGMIRWYRGAAGGRGSSACRSCTPLSGIVVPS